MATEYPGLTGRFFDRLGIKADNRPVVAGPHGSALATFDAVIAVLQAIRAALWLLFRSAVRITLHVAVLLIGGRAPKRGVGVPALGGCEGDQAATADSLRRGSSLKLARDSRLM